MLRALVLCLTAAAAALFLRRSSAEFSLFLALAALLALFPLLSEPFAALFSLFDDLLRLTALSPSLLSPLLKTVAIALTARIGCALCRDADQHALAAALDAAGALCAMAAAAPLLRAVLSLVEEWL